MCNKIKCKKAKFWIEDGVLICEFSDDNCIKKFSEYFSEEYLKAITKLSNGGYFPLLIDLRKLDKNYAFSIALILSKRPELKLAILSKSFVVNSYFLKFVLTIFGRIYDSIIPNRIFMNYNKAIEYSLETHQNFYAHTK
ncbi:DUF7793 family protein [Confluentibacter lentus]|uniref:DUF7793 family protein n=1 Tax=Confluentibacter lentus TaxID=1699412 RepID=UPI000C2938F2|nr:hypothetical protein [Confluentibacter lentus]